MSRLAILAFAGSLPGRLAAAHPDALYVAFGDDSAAPPPGIEVAGASYERWGALFRTLRDADVTDVVMAGGLARPRLKPSRFDPKTLALAPKLMAALKGGDDQLLRTVILLFEREGFVVRGAHELVDGLTAPAGLLCGPKPSAAAMEDIAAAAGILTALGPLDVGQGAVVAGGLPDGDHRGRRAGDLRVDPSPVGAGWELGHEGGEMGARLVEEGSDGLGAHELGEPGLEQADSALEAAAEVPGERWNERRHAYL